MTMLIGDNRSIMQSKVNSRAGNTLGWITTIAMGIAAVSLSLTLGTGQSMVRGAAAPEGHKTTP